MSIENKHDTHRPERTGKSGNQEGVKELTDEPAKRESMLRRMEDIQSENQYAIHELSGIKKRLLSFEEYAKDNSRKDLELLSQQIMGLLKSSIKSVGIFLLADFLV